MTDEEKKAIDVIKSLGISIYNGKSQIIPGDTTKEISTAIYTTINLIEKQSKEIEELKEDRDKFKKALGKRITYCNELEKDLFENCSNYVVSKDKIKAKIEELQKEKIEMTVDIINHNTLAEIIRDEQINILQLLLEKE